MYDTIFNFWTTLKLLEHCWQKSSISYYHNIFYHLNMKFHQEPLIFFLLHTIHTNLRLGVLLKFNLLRDDKNFRLVQIETNCRRHFKVHLKWKINIIYGRKHCEKRRNFLLQAVFPFLTMFSTAIYL